MTKSLSASFENTYDTIKMILETSRSTVYRAANSEMVNAYWNIGRTIVEEKQKGSNRADYRRLLVESISARLTSEFGKGFDKTNIWNMIKFYRTFPILDAVRRQLSWTHYRLLMRVENEDAREFYLQEAIEGNWSTRQLNRQINCFYFERVIMSEKEGRALVKKEFEDKKEEMQPSHIIKDPYVLEFLDLKTNTVFYENKLASTNR